MRGLRWLILAVLLFSCALVFGEGRAVKRRVQPSYPELAKKMHVQGTVVVEAKVDADGHVTEVKVISGSSLLKDAAVTAVKDWVYEVAPTPTTETIQITFHI